MGMVRCYKKNCQNILCGRFSHKYGYLCNECFDELIKSGPETNLDNFMGKPFQEEKDRRIAAETRFNTEFPLIDFKF
jgi:hypothetical protein